MKEIISQIKDEVDLVGVSSANEGAVTEEWKGAGIYSLFRFVACQSVGKKDRIIQKALECGYEKDNTVRLGDALGDIEASKANGAQAAPARVIERYGAVAVVACWLNLSIRSCE